MSKFVRVTVTTKLGQLSLDMTDSQSEQLDHMAEVGIEPAP